MLFRKLNILKPDFNIFQIVSAVVVVFVLVAGGIFVWRYFQPELSRAGVGQNMTGWVWSENVGWISLNSSNCDIDDDGIMDRVNVGSGSGDASASSACPPDGTTIPIYGVAVDRVTGNLSGHAWGETIGWISFNRSDTGTPPTAPYNGSETFIANLDDDVNSFNGWGRALNYGGGWDGWIKLGL